MRGLRAGGCQSIAFAGAGQSESSHHTSYVPSASGTSATFVKIVSFDIDAIAFGLLLEFVPGTTPKYPASGLIPRSRPVSLSTHIHTMSSPSVVTRQPWS